MTLFLAVYVIVSAIVLLPFRAAHRIYRFFRPAKIAGRPVVLYELDEVIKKLDSKPKRGSGNRRDLGA